MAMLAADVGLGELVVKIGGLDCEAVWSDTRLGMARFWPLLAAFAVADMAAYVGVAALSGEAQLFEPGLAGYIGYLRFCAFDLVPGGLLYAVPVALVMNGLSERPIGRARIVQRAVRALPAIVLASLISWGPFLLSNLVTYSAVDTSTWWLAYAGGILGAVAIWTVFNSVLVR